jgi:uncharacterized membrane protein YedE/YeeE
MTDGTYLLVAVASLALGLAAGAVMHRSDYCLAGMLRDLFLFKRAGKLRSLVLLIVVTMLLFEGARLLGLLPNFPFPLFYAPSAANVVGGMLFGVGMVLAGGCVVRTLYRMGAGRLLSAVAFAGLLVGSGLYAEIFPFWSGSSARGRTARWSTSTPPGARRSATAARNPHGSRCSSCSTRPATPTAASASRASCAARAGDRCARRS